MRNAGDYKHRITIVRNEKTTDGDGFNAQTAVEVVKAWAKINTTKGYTLITQGSNFEDATTRFLIRKPTVEIDRKMHVLFKGKVWRIRYLNNIDETDEEIELQCEEVTQ